ncbi:hypothetical protein B9P78_08795 [Aerococcus sp. 1KP-2016]|nr:hypothetical protein B9P78_08795 [Aerococcus sp. 1KP-2016]
MEQRNIRIFLRLFEEVVLSERRELVQNIWFAVEDYIEIYNHYRYHKIKKMTRQLIGIIFVCILISFFSLKVVVNQLYFLIFFKFYMIK